MDFKSTGIRKWLFVIILAALTVLFHYMYGMSHIAVLEAIHRRLCYIPIVLGGLWFGMYGGIGTAAGISIAIIPFVYTHTGMHKDFVSGELVEMVFYLFIGWLTGMLTDAQRKEREKNDMLKEQLRSSERLSTIGELFAYMMHEIKNPLNSIKGTADIIADRTVDQQKKLEFAGLLKDEINRLNRTLDAMLGYTNMHLEYTTCDLLDEISTIVRLFSSQAEKSRVKINLSSTESIRMEMDCDRMRQVFINLIINAIQAMPDGGVLDIMLNKPDDMRVDIMFKDTGSGIRAEHMNSLFKPFFTTRRGGTGLGLAVSKRMVEEHGGRLSVQSEQGRGSVFTVRLPCSR